MTRALPATTIGAGTVLYHLSQTAYAGAPLYFGCRGNRYDDPAGHYGVLYLARDLATALMETVFHDHRWREGERSVTPGEVAGRLVRMIGTVASVQVLDFNTPGLMAAEFGLSLSELASREYVTTRRVSAEVHASTSLDGILFPSHNNYPGACLALFDRALPKLALLADMPLARHPDWRAFKDRYGVRIRP